MFTDYLKIQYNKMDFSSKVLLLWLSLPFILTVAKFILHRLGIDDGILRESILFLISSIPLVILFLNKSQVYKRALPFVYLFIIIVVIILITFMFNIDSRMFLTRENYGLLRVLRPDCAIYAFLFFSMLENPSKILDVIKKYAYLDFIYLLIVEYLPRLIRGYWIDINYLGQSVQYQYNLSFGYLLLLPVIVFLYFYIKERKFHYLFIIAGGLFLIFTQGSRGALLVVGIFAGLMILNNIMETKEKKQRLIKLSLILLLCLVVIMFGHYLINMIVSLLKNIGIHSRTLDLFASGEITNDSGRSIIWNAVIEGIKNGSIWGYGFFGDRPFVYPFHYVGYSHNIFLELIISFGLFGIIIILLMIIGACLMIFKCSDNQWREIFIIYFSLSCQLMISMSFWYVPEFWATLAIGYTYFKIYRRKRKDSIANKVSVEECQIE